MTKTIDTLVDDIYKVMDEGAEVSEDDAVSFGKLMARVVTERLGEPRKASYLRLSNLGSVCDRKLWFDIRHHELGEPLPPDAKLKFLIGDVWEAVLLLLARVAGHDVQGEQDEVELYGVKGHRDAVIDGTIVDAKSASSFAFVKFADGLTEDKDDFGYLTQLDTYLETGQNDPVVTDKNRAAFLAGDKQLGKLALDVHERKGIDYEKMVAEKRAMLDQDTPPPRAFKDEPDGYYKGKGKSREFIPNGNRKLGTVCSYCQFKHACWPGLRTFIYSGNKPKFMTYVKPGKEPGVPEAGKEEDHPF